MIQSLVFSLWRSRIPSISKVRRANLPSNQCALQQTPDGPASDTLRKVSPEPLKPHPGAGDRQQEEHQAQAQRSHWNSGGGEDHPEG